MRKFKEFIQYNLPWRALAEMALMGAEGDRMPVSPSVINVLNVIPKSLQSSVLKWVYTEGLRKALVERKAFAERMSRDLGVPIPQDAIFSKQAQKDIPQLGQSYPQIEEMWFNSGREPNDIPLKLRGPGDKPVIKRLNLQDINIYLTKNGKTPLHFGGVDGLISEIERGDYMPVEKQAVRFGNRGHDLTLGKFNPQGKREDPYGREFYVFGSKSDTGGYKPIMNDEYWATQLKLAHIASQKTLWPILQKLKSGEAVPENIYPELQKAFANGLIDFGTQKELLHHVAGLNARKSGKTVQVLDEKGQAKVIEQQTTDPLDDVTFQRLKQAISACIDNGLNLDRETAKAAKPKSQLMQSFQPPGGQMAGQAITMWFTAGLLPSYPYPWWKQENPQAIRESPRFTTATNPQEIKNTVMRMLVDDVNRVIKLRITKRYSDDPPGTNTRIQTDGLISNGMNHLIAKQTPILDTPPEALDVKKEIANGSTVNGVGDNILLTRKDGGVFRLEKDDNGQPQKDANGQLLYQRIWSNDDRYVTLNTLKHKAHPQFGEAQEGQLRQMEPSDLLKQGWVIDNITDSEESNNWINAERKRLLFSKEGVGRRELIRGSDNKWYELLPKHDVVDLDQEQINGAAIHRLQGSRTALEVIRKDGETFTVRRGQDENGRPQWFRVADPQVGSLEGHLDSQSLWINQNADVPKGQELPPEDANALFDDWYANPDAYGKDRPVSIDGAVAPASVAKTIHGFLYSRGLQHMAGDAIQDTLFNLRGQAGRPQFVWGEVDEEHLPSDLDDAQIYAIRQLTQRFPFTRKWPNKHTGGEPVMGDSIRDDIYALMLNNGKKWRANKALGAAYAILGEKPRGAGVAKSGEDAPSIIDLLPSKEKEFNPKVQAWDEEPDTGEPEFAQYDKEAPDSPDEARPEPSGALAKKRALYAGRTKVRDASMVFRPEDEPKLPDVLPSSLPSYVQAPRAPGVAPQVPPEEPKTIKMPLDEPITGRPAAVATAAQQPPFVVSTPSNVAAQKPAQTDDEFMAGLKAQSQALKLARRQKFLQQFDQNESRFMSYKTWREMAGTGVVYGYSRKKAHLPDGCGFNIWGEPGRTGVNIDGEIKTMHKDGKKYGRRQAK